MEFKPFSKKLGFLAAAVLSVSVFTSSAAFADKKNYDVSYMDNCRYLPLVNNPENPATKTVCVDAPVALEKVKAIFDMTLPAVEGKPHTGLRHMGMLAEALMGRINKGLIDPEDINIIGVIHGSSAVKSLATIHSNESTKQLINKIFTLKNKGVNINLEVCGVTLQGMITNSLATGGNPDEEFELYENLGNVIHVNQGAIGRMIDLQQQRFTLIKE